MTPLSALSGLSSDGSRALSDSRVRKALAIATQKQQLVKLAPQQLRSSRPPGERIELVIDRAPRVLLKPSCVRQRTEQHRACAETEA